MRVRTENRLEELKNKKTEPDSHSDCRVLFMPILRRKRVDKKDEFDALMEHGDTANDTPTDTAEIVEVEY